MRGHFKKSFFILVLFANGVRAQIYPVQGSATLIPPYALRFSDYTTSTSERIVFNVLLADVTKAELHVRLRLSIVAQNLKIETKPEYIGSPITLQGGVPLRLTNVELSEYFDLNHLNFSGTSKSELLKNGFLPEGFYQFCFEVYEYGRNAKVSNTICAPAWLILNDPPIVNVPRNGEKLKPLTPQNVIFQWTPRHTGSPNSAFTTEYDIKVVEVWPSNRNPNDAILTQPPIYETTTHNTTFIYGPEATQLELGRTYAFRVQARAMAGAEQLDLFKNNGFSETVAFVYGDACDAPVNILSDVSPTKVTLNWDASISQTGYTVHYRSKGQLQWYPSTSLIPSVQINDLQPNTTYEYQAMATCGSFESNFGDISTITTPDLPLRSYSCGAPLENINLDPTQIIPVLNVGDLVRAGDFDVTTTKVTGSSGIFTGEGTVTLPFFNNARARVKFDGITVNRDKNSEKRMMKGQMVVIGPAIVPQSLLNSMDQLSQAMKVADSVLNLTRQALTDKPAPENFVPDEVINAPAGIRNASYDVATGKITIVDNNGKQQSLSPDKNYAITDGTGGGVIVSKNGGVEKVGAGEMGKILNRKYDLNLAFTNSTESRYGIDVQKEDAMKKNYEQLNGTYLVPFKAVAVGSADPVSATLMIKNMDLNKIKFDQDNTAVEATIKGENIVLKATAKTKGDNSPIMARMIDDKTKQETIVGKLSVKGYTPENLKLHIVPVNGMTVSTSASDIEKQLNAIYSQAVVSWTVAVEANLTVDGVASPFDNGGSGALSTYTGDMKTVINTFLTKTKLENDNYYLFLVPKGTNPDENGYMPRSKQCGFIFLDPPMPNAQSPMPSAQIIRTMAHELGHGAFTLEHTFADYPTLTQGTTDNLMDYSSGTTLMKYQWDIIHNPRIVLGLFESDEAGASWSVPCVGIFDDCDDVIKKIDAVKKAYADKKVLTGKIPKNLSDKILEAKHVRIEDVDYDDIKVIYLGGYQINYTINPGVYGYYYSIVHEDKIKPENQIVAHGIEFRDVNTNEKVLRILIEENSLTEADLFEKLRTYIFGQEREVKRNNASVVTASSNKAVEDVQKIKKTSDPACNFCVRNALLNLSGDSVLFPKSGSYISFTAGEKTIKGNVSGVGLSTDMINDLTSNRLDEFFEEEMKNESETYEQFWARLQGKVDKGNFIVGTFRSDHIFSIVPGGPYKVVDNTSHSEGGWLKAEFKANPIMDEGDKYGFVFVSRGIKFVPRILECGGGFKSSNAPMYANMDYNGCIESRWFRYKK